MKQVRLLLAAIAFILSQAAAAENQPVLTGGRGYNSYYKLYQMQHVGGGEVVALASAKNNAAVIHLMKFSASGDIAWDRNFSGGVRDYGKSLTRTTDGGFLICGHTMLNDGTDRYKILLIKTDAGGNLQWQKSYGGSGADHEWGWFAWQREDGGFGIFGGIRADAPNDLYVALTDTSGTLLTENRFSGSVPLNDVPPSDQPDIANGKPTQDGGCIVHTKTDLIKLTPQGTVAWTKNFSSLGGAPKIDDVAETSDLGFAFVVSRLSVHDAYLKKLDPVGNESWSVNISDVSPFTFYPKSVQVTSDGGLLIGGTDYKPSDGKRTVLKTDAAGTAQWSLFIPPFPAGDAHAEIYSIVEQGPKQYVVAGYSASNSSQPEFVIRIAFLGRIEVDPKSAARLSTKYQ